MKGGAVDALRARTIPALRTVVHPECLDGTGALGLVFFSDGAIEFGEGGHDGQLELGGQADTPGLESGLPANSTVQHTAVSTDMIGQVQTERTNRSMKGHWAWGLSAQRWVLGTRHHN